MRTEMGLTVEQAAERLLVSASKVSRLETGQRGASARDIRDLCDLYGVTGEDRQLLTELAAEGKQRAWWQSFNLPYSAYVGLEADAVTIRDFALGVVPGLLQTEAYAWEILRAGFPREPTAVLQRLVEARLERQHRVLSDPSRTFTAVVDECVLHRVVGSPAIMAEQLARLLDAMLQPNVAIRVVPFAAGTLPVFNNKFIIMGFDRPAMADVVYLESLTGELFLEREDELRVYNEAYETLLRMAAPPEDTRAMIASLAHGYGQ